MIPIVFDLDSTIAQPSSTGLYQHCVPYDFVVKLLRKLWHEKDEQGRPQWRIRIQTARYMLKCNGDIVAATAAGYREAADWLMCHGIPFDELSFGKASGELYVDDKGCRVDSSQGESGWQDFHKRLGQLRQGG